MVQGLLEGSLPFVDGEKFTSNDDYRWGMICFCYGAALSSSVCVDSREAISCCTSVFAGLFDWPVAGTTQLLEEASTDNDNSSRLMREHGGLAMEDYERSLQRFAFASSEIVVSIKSDAVVSKNSDDSAEE